MTTFLDTLAFRDLLLILPDNTTYLTTTIAHDIDDHDSAFISTIHNVIRTRVSGIFIRSI